MSSPSVSVIVPVFNRVEFLAEALESILAQSYDGLIEIIVVDDGSEEPVEPRFAATFPTVRFLRQPNRGLGAARQAGAVAATGEVLAHLDDDDVWPTDSLRRRVAVLAAHPEVHVVAGDIAHQWPHKPARVGYYRSRFPRLEQAPRRAASACADAWIYERGALVDAILLGLPFFAQSIVAHREWFHAIGGWDVDSTIFTECYGFCYRATMAGAIGYVDHPVAHIRRGHVQATSDLTNNRLMESRGLAAWGRRLDGPDRIRVVPRLARRLLAQSVKFARQGRGRGALELARLGWQMASRAPLSFVQRPWRHLETSALTLRQVPGR